MQKFDYQILTLLTKVDSDLIVWQAYHQTPRTVAATTKIDILQRLHITAAILRKHGAGTDRGCCRCGHRVQGHQKNFALKVSPIGCSRLQIQHHTRPVASLNHIGRLQVSLVDIDKIAASRITDALEVQRNARRRLNRKTGRHGRKVFRELNSNDLCAVLDTSSNCLNRPLRGCTHAESTARRKAGGLPKTSNLDLAPDHLFTFPSCRPRVLVRSTHSPAAS